MGGANLLHGRVLGDVNHHAVEFRAEPIVRGLEGHNQKFISVVFSVFFILHLLFAFFSLPYSVRPSPSYPASKSGSAVSSPVGWGGTRRENAISVYLEPKA